MRRAPITIAVALALSLLGGCAPKPESVEPVAAAARPAVTATPAPAPAAADSTALASGERELPQDDLAPVYFGFESDELGGDATATLRRAADLLRSYPDARLTIEGHCDERGTSEYNMALGERRARVTRDYLVRLGVAAARLGTVTYGEERPAAAGRDEDAWAKNRRSELVLADGSR